MFLQLYDFKFEIHEVYAAERNWENKFSKAIQDHTKLQENYKHVMIVSEDIIYDNQKLMEIADFALDEKMTTNCFRVTRISKDDCYAEAMRQMEQRLSQDTIYIFTKSDNQKMIRYSMNYL